MYRISTPLRSILVFTALLLSFAAASAAEWPIKEKIDLSSGFGEYRPRHFHGGIDIRTGGKTGMEVFSPVDGYIWQVKTAYGSSGKALYIKGDDGYFYVMFHLDRFVTDLDRLVRSKQTAEETYQQEIQFPVDSIRVKEGQLVAYTGQTGYGGPHLHFEKRTADNRPIHPLKNGFDLNDKVRPIFRRVAFELTHPGDLFVTGRRFMQFDIPKSRKAGEYKLDTVLSFDQPFGILTDAIDLIRPDGPDQSVYSLKLYINDKLYYQSILDTLDYNTTRSVELEYDYYSALGNDPDLRRLYQLEGNRFSGSSSRLANNGIFGISGEKIGLYHVRLEATDCFDNTSTLNLDFLWVPEKQLITLDSTILNDTYSGKFYFTAIPEWKEIGIDSIIPFRNRAETWYRCDDVTYEEFGENSFMFDIAVKRVDVEGLRLFVFHHGKGLYRTDYFNGITDRGKPKMDLTYLVTPDGLLVNIRAQQKMSTQPQILLYYQGKLLGREYPTPYNMTTYQMLIPPKPEYKRIDRIDYATCLECGMYPKTIDSLNIFIVGYEPQEKIDIGRFFRINIGSENLYKPQFIELNEAFIMNKSQLRMNSDLLEIIPPSFLCRKDFEVNATINPVGRDRDKSGFYWLDEDENRWYLMDDSRYSNDSLSAAAGGGGKIAVIYDDIPPEISNLNVHSEGYNLRRNFKIKFETKDTLSGLGENCISVKFDSKWIVPEYDPETFQCVAIPPEPRPGKHHVAILVTDKAGNLAEQYLSITVR